MSEPSNVDWPQARDIVYRALELPVTERDEFVRGSTGSVPGLTQYVLELLQIAAGEDDPVPVGASAPDFVDEAFRRPASMGPAIGDRVGAYRLIKQIGEGGMGSVYLGERADETFEHHVAIKLVHDRIGGQRARDRFQAEEQILGGLVHPGIARLYDAGVAGDDQPYFVMEYVDGMPITKYCDEMRLTVDERLNLFIQVCDAVSYAQQHLVVHRDLKPSNVLVSTDGKVKLLDFGIAKIIDPESEDETKTRTRFLTPIHAAPEQLTGDKITTATDVFSLGVVLFEMLTGRIPYDDTGSHAKIVRAVCEELPRAPSKTVTASESAPDATDRQRSRKLGRELRGDLDAIVLAALRKEPSQRYVSAEAFGDDVRRHRNGIPVRARRQTRSYRARRFVRRHKGAVAMSVAFVASLLVFTVIVFLQRQAVIKERDLVVHNDKVQEELRKIDTVNLTSEAAVLEAIERVADEVYVDYADDPNVIGDVLQALSYKAKGFDRDRALSLMQRSHAVFRERFGETNENAIYTLDELGVINLELGNYAAADSFSERALALATRGEVRGLSIVRSHRRRVLYRLRRFDEALELLRLNAAIPGYDNAGLHDAFFMIFTELGEFDSAEVHLDQALAMSPYQRDDPRLLPTHSRRAGLLLKRRDWAAAESAATEVVALARGAPPSFGDQTYWVVDALMRAAIARRGLRDFVVADSLLREARALNVSLGGYRDDDGLDYWLARNLTDLGRTGEANVVLSAMLGRTLAPGWYAHVSKALAELHLDAGRYDDVLQLEPSDVTLNARALIERGDFGGAEEVVLESHRSEDPRPEHRPEHTARLLTLRARIALETDDLESARRLAQGAINIVDSLQFWRGGRDRAIASSLIGQILTEERRYDEAEPMLTDSYSFLKEWYGPRSSYDLLLAEKRVKDFYRITRRPMPDSLF